MNRDFRRLYTDMLPRRMLWGVLFCVLLFLVNGIGAVLQAAPGDNLGSDGGGQTIAVPSYFYPGALWTQLEEASPAVGLAIINPNSGPGAAVNADYLAQVTSSQAAGLTVIGYVHTQYGARSAATVQAEIDAYYSFYPTLDGIFVDEVPTGCADVTYYEDLYAYVQTKGGTGLTVLNPGTQTNVCYMDAGDVILNFEDTYANYVGSYTQPAWVTDYPASRFWHLVHTTPDTAAIRNAIALSKSRHAGWIYVTNDALPNPWDTLPTGDGWTAELRDVSTPGPRPAVGPFQASHIWPIAGAGTADLSSTFGPRLKASEGFRYDWHRGIDIPAACNTAVLAVADGEIRRAGTVSGYSDTMVQIRHAKPGGGFYYSNYLHLTSVAANPATGVAWTQGDAVSQGDTIAYSGDSDIEHSGLCQPGSDGGFDHLHFEIRDGGVLQKHLIHPLLVLQSADANAPQVQLTGVDAGAPLAPGVSVRVQIPRTELDLQQVAVTVYDDSGGAPVEVDRAVLHMHDWNYTHTPYDGASNVDILDTSPAGDGVYDGDYGAGPMVGAPLGVAVSPARFNADSNSYLIDLRFTNLAGVADGDNLVVTAEASDLYGNSAAMTAPHQLRLDTPQDAIYVWRGTSGNGIGITLAEAQRLATFALAKGIRTIYYDNYGCGPVSGTCPLPNAVQDAATLAPIIDLFHANGLRVEALYTDNGRIADVLSYNSAVDANERFDGIRLNIESGSFPANGAFDPGEPFTDQNANGEYDTGEPFDDFGLDGVSSTNDPGEGNGRYNRGEPYRDFGLDHEEGTGDSGEGNGQYDPGERYFDQGWWPGGGKEPTGVVDLNVFIEAVSSAGYLPVYVSISHHWDEPITYNGQSRPAYQHILDIVAGIDIQTAQDSAASIVNISRDEVCYANQLVKPAHVTIETYDVVQFVGLQDHNTFFEEGEAAMTAELATADYAGVVSPCSAPQPSGYAYHFYTQSYGSSSLAGWAYGPNAEAGGPYAGTEGSPVAFDGSASTPVGSSFSWDFGDGDSATGETPSHSYTDDGIFTVELTVTDSQGATDTESTSATIANAPPVLTVPGSEVTVDKASALTLEATFTDPGTGDTHTATIDWGTGDGPQPATVTENDGAGDISGSHTYAVAGSYTARITVTDDDGGSDTETVTVTVRELVDLIFVIDLTGSMWDDIAEVKSRASEIVQDLESRNLNFRVAIVGYRDHPIAPYGNPGDFPYQDALAFTGDEATITTVIDGLTVGGGADWEESVYSGLLRAINTDAASLGEWRLAAQKRIVLMGDAPPHDPEPVTGYTQQDILDAIDLIEDESGVLGRAAVRATAVRRPVAIHGIIIGDDAPTHLAFSELAAETGGSTELAAEALNVVGAILTTIEKFFNTPPVAVISPLASATEGTAVDFDGSTSMDPQGGSLTYTWTFGDTATGSGETASHTYADNGVYSACLTVTSTSGLSDTACTQVNVGNVSPEVAASAGEPGREGVEPVEVTATFSDPGFDNPDTFEVSENPNPVVPSQESFTGSVDWGDGNVTTLSEADLLWNSGSPGVPTSGSLAASHIYADDGSYEVTVCVTDDDGGSGCHTVTAIVENLPPEVTLDTGDAIPFGDGSAFLGRQGEAQSHSGAATDPGADDLSFVWNGNPTATYPSNGTAPAGASDTTTLLFPALGVYAVEVVVSDDDGDSDSDSLPKLITGNETCSYGLGFWRHQFRDKKHAHYDRATLEQLLAVVNHASRVFSEEEAADTYASAGQVFAPGGSSRKPKPEDPSNMQAKAVQHSLAAWLNFASGAVGWQETIALDDGTALPFSALMATVEDILLDPTSVHRDYVNAKNLAEAVNGSAACADEDEPDLNPGKKPKDSEADSQPRLFLPTIVGPK